jgi:hypothetical protein
MRRRVSIVHLSKLQRISDLENSRYSVEMSSAPEVF